MADLSRRAFFKRGLAKVTKTAVDYADKKVTQKATQWIRPPYALNELDFLLACNRCGDCITSCPHDVIFSLPISYGNSVVKTPALDLINKACHLCEDWPCVTACEPAALKLPKLLNTDNSNSDQLAEPDNEGQNIPPPKLAQIRISSELCLPFMGPECGACQSSCKITGALTWDMTKPVINDDLCSGCGLCRDACITAPKAITIHSIKPVPNEEEVTV